MPYMCCFPCRVTRVSLSQELLERFDTVHSCFSDLKPEYQRVIADITREMGFGMAEHMDETACVTIADYDRYCHYVAGLVGLGLTRMFAVSGLESPALADPRRDHLANSMGLFLQKTNIIRDYLEDLTDGRTFWPEEIWSVYADRLGAFAAPEQRKAALSCLNAMVTDALRHVPDCLEYMSAIRSPTVFHFVAIPQVMAMATLAEVYANPGVFAGVVKLRRGKTAVLIARATSVESVHALFFQSAVGMRAAIAPADPSVEETRGALERIIRRSLPHVPATPDLTVPNRLSLIAFVTLSSYLLRRRAEHNDGTSFSWRRGGIPEPLDMLAAAALFLVMMWLFSFFGLQFVTAAGLRPRPRAAAAGRSGGGGGGGGAARGRGGGGTGPPPRRPTTRRPAAGRRAGAPVEKRRIPLTAPPPRRASPGGRLNLGRYFLGRRAQSAAAVPPLGSRGGGGGGGGGGLGG